MKIGLRAHDLGKFPAEALAEKIRTNGFCAAQLAIPKAIDGIESYFEVTEPHCETIRTAFEKEKIEISVLGCYINPALLDKEKRTAELAVFFKALECAPILGAKMVGTETTHFDRAENEREKAFDILTDSVLRMVERAEKTGAVVGIEPVKAHTLNTPELTAKLLERVGSERLVIIFDAVNLLSPQSIPVQERLWAECFEAFGEKIAAVHLKDTRVVENRLVDAGCPLGDGVMEFGVIYEWLRKHKSDVSVLREGFQSAFGARDVAYMRGLIG